MKSTLGIIALEGILMCSSLFLLVQNYFSLADYLQYRTEIDVRIKQEIAPFPAVTVCTDLGGSHFMDRDDTIDKEPIQLSDFVLSGTFNREPLTKPASTNDFREFLNVDYYGHCFTYNWDISRRLRTAKSGPKYGLRLMLNANSSKSGRVRIVVHEQGVAPVPTKSGLTASSGHTTSIGLKQTAFRRLSEPHGLCQLSDVGFMFKYSQEKCRSGCINSQIFVACDCAFPPNPLIKHNPHQCKTTEQRNCLDRERRWRENDHANCNCAPDCEESIYETTSSSSSLPSILSACSFNGTERKCTEYSSSNIAVVEVYPVQNHFEMLVERPAYPLSHFLSDVARNGILLLVIVTLAVMLPRARGQMEQIVYEKAPLTCT